MISPRGQTEHATAVFVADRGVLIRGAAGSGKSSLALALIDGTHDDSTLVADDRVLLTVEGGALLAEPPDALAGLLEVRGVGIVRRPFIAPVPIWLVVDLLPLADCPRLPTEAERTVAVHGVLLPRLSLPTGASDGPLRVRVALAEWCS